MASSYCDVVEKMELSNVHRIYHDTEYGFPIEDDDALFERLMLEINQAGLSWTTILNKKENFHRAFHGFKIDKVAAYKVKDVNRLLNDAGIIRNKLKVAAAIENAKRLKVIRKEYGSFKNWLNHHHPKTKQEWVEIFKTEFKFTGGEIVNEFLMSIGYLKGAHMEGCPVYKKVLNQQPRWSLSKSEKRTK